MTLVPAELMGGFGCWSLTHARADKATPGLYWTPAVTPLPAAPDSDVHLRVEVDGVIYRPVARRPEPLREPEPKPKRRGRSGDRLARRGLPRVPAARSQPA